MLLLFIFTLSGWELDVGIVEYRGREWRVNTAGWLDVLFVHVRVRECVCEGERRSKTECSSVIRCFRICALHQLA